MISPDAGLTAFIQLEPSTLSMFRGLGMLVTMALFSLLFYGRGLLSYFNELPWQAWMIPPLYAVVPIMWIYGVKYAGAGQVLAVLAIAPLVAALSSRWFLGERLEWATIVASLIALIGILVTVFPLFEGHLPPQILSMIEATPARALLDQATTATVHGEAVGAHGTLAARHPLYGLGVLFSLLIPVIYAVMLTFSRKVPRANSWPMIAIIRPASAIYHFSRRVADCDARARGGTGLPLVLGPRSAQPSPVGGRGHRICDGGPVSIVSGHARQKVLDRLCTQLFEHSTAKTTVVPNRNN